MGLIGKAEGVESEGLGAVLLWSDKGGRPIFDGLKNFVLSKVW